MAPVRRPRSRRAVVLAVGIVAGAAALDSARRARRHEVGDREERVFRWWNRRSDRLVVPMWIVMQSGSLGAVAVAAGAQARSRGHRPAGVVAAVGTAVWLGVKVAKPAVGRGRPAAHLDGVIVRGAPQSGLGYPSGHAAVVTALALMLLADDGRVGASRRLIALADVAVTGAARMYVGAHLPLDVLGGTAIGTAAGLAGAARVGRAGGSARPSRGLRMRRGR